MLIVLNMLMMLMRRLRLWPNLGRILNTHTENGSRGKRDSPHFSDQILNDETRRMVCMHVM